MTGLVHQEVHDASHLLANLEQAQHLPHNRQLHDEVLPALVLLISEEHVDTSDDDELASVLKMDQMPKGNQ